MFWKATRCCAVMMLGVVPSWQLPAAAQDISIVEQSQAKAVIVVGAFPTPDELSAANELSHYIGKATGASLRMHDATSADGSPGVRIHVGASVLPPAMQAKLGTLKPDSYVVEVLDDAVFLGGNQPHGTSFAVYEFLERFAGIRWLWPGDLGEVVPRQTSLRVQRLQIVREPAFVWRNLGPGGALWGALDRWTKQREMGIGEEHQRLQMLWEKRNRFGGEQIYGGHAFGQILPPEKYGPVHPEYFALVKGKRDWKDFDGKHGAQPCTTNPDVIRLTVDFCRRFFDHNPDFSAFSISLNDGSGFCECDRCRRLDTGAMIAPSGDPEAGRAKQAVVITDRIVTFGNQVAAEIAKTHPDKKLILFAYDPYRQPPVRVRPADNLIIQYTFHAAENWNPEAEQRQLRETGAWSSAAKNLAIYEYFIQGNSPDLPRLMPVPLQRSIARLYHSCPKQQAGL